MSKAMTRSDRSWTAVVAECALDRARPILAALRPDPFTRIDLARALTRTGLMPDRAMPFETHLWPRLAEELGPDAAPVRDALASLPFDPEASPATTLWRALLRDLHGDNHPALTGDDALHWTAFITALRGRTPASAFTAPWLQQIAQQTQAHRDLLALAATCRAGPMTPLDRSLYIRFGWNDEGSVPGLTGLIDAAALIRTQRAWTLASPHFDAPAQTRILSAAQHMVTMGRVAAMASINDDVRRYGIPRAELAAGLYPVRVVPPLTALLQEAA